MDAGHARLTGDPAATSSFIAPSVAKGTFLKSESALSDEIEPKKEVQVIAQQVFSNYPDTHTPKKKSRGFNTNNIKVADIAVVKYFLYGYQILKKWRDDKYTGLRFAVEAYNKEKSLANIDKIAKQLQLLKASDSSEFNDSTLKKLADEVAIYKFKMLLANPEQIKFNLNSERNLTVFKDIDPDLKQLLEQYNLNKTKEKFIEIHEKLFDWIQTSKVKKEHPAQIQQILYELSSYVEDPQIYELFNLLKTDKTYIAHHKIEDLIEALGVDDGRAIKLCKGEVLNLPQIKTRFSRSKEISVLNRAIKKFNKNKTPDKLILVAVALQDWQFKDEAGFNSNTKALKIIGEMNEILKGVSKQDKIEKLEGFIFLKTNKDKMQGTKVKEWDSTVWDYKSWKELPMLKSKRKTQIPSGLMKKLNNAIKTFNENKKEGNSLHSSLWLKEITATLLLWAEKNPDEFNTCGGEALLKAMQSRVLSSVVKEGIQSVKAIQSNELQAVNEAVKFYNKNPSIASLKEVETRLIEWKEKAPNSVGKEIVLGEFSKYHGDTLLQEVQIFLQANQNALGGVKSKSFPTILLPNSHPAEVFDKSLALGPPNHKDKSAYLLVFHNPIAPWSHSEIGIAKGAASLNTSSFISKPDLHRDPAIFNNYFVNGVLVKDINEYKFANSRQYVHNVLNHVIVSNSVREFSTISPQKVVSISPQKVLQEKFINTDVDAAFDADFAKMVYEHFEEIGYIDKNGKVTSKYFDPPKGEGPNDWDFVDDKIKDKARDFIISVMPKPMNPSEFEKQIEISKSKQAFNFLKNAEIIKADGSLDREKMYQDSSIWNNITNFYKGDDVEYGEYIITLLATQLNRNFTETSFIRAERTPEESTQLFNFLNNNKLLQESPNAMGEPKLYLKKDWVTLIETNPQIKAQFENLPHREALVQQLAIMGKAGETTGREYLGIGAEQEGLDQVSQSAEGVRITDSRLVDRMEKLCKRRKNEIQKNMNVFAGIRGGVRALLKGGYATLLHTKEDKVRHFRNALIDNFLTSVDPQAFLPNLKEPRFRLEVYESGGEIYRKWVEDPNGKFGKVKNLSKGSQDQSGEYVEGEYRKNSYVLEADGRLKSVKSLDKLKLETHERGNIVEMADGTQEWREDAEFGQCFKPKGTDKTDLRDVEKDDRPLYSAMNCEKYLSNGESEWCGSYAIRMLHSAYAFECMPEFQPLLDNLNRDFASATSFDKKDKDNSLFEKRHATALFILADQYAKKMVASEAGEKYFRDMHPGVRLNPRCTPDQIHEFLVGKDPGLLNSAARAAKTMQMPSMRKDAGQKMGVSLIVGTAIGTGLTAVLGASTAALKLAFNVTSATLHVFTTDLIKAAHQSYRRKAQELDRNKEAGKKVRFRSVRLFKAIAFNGLLVDGLGKRVGMQYLGGQELVDSAKKIKKWATPGFRKAFRLSAKPIAASAFA